MNIDAVTPAALFDRKLVLLGSPAADRPRRMGRMDRVGEQHNLVIAQRIQEVVIALDECLLLRLIELARNDVRLVICEPEAMQQRDQTRAAFVNEAEFLLDKGADLTRRARQCGADKDLQGIFLRGAQKARAAAHVKTDQALSSNSTNAFARRVNRDAAEPSPANATSRPRSSALRKPPRIMPQSGIHQPTKCKEFLPSLQ